MVRYDATEDDLEYIRQRGFEIVEADSKPGREQELPYLLLYGHEQGPVSDMVYHNTHTGGAISMGKITPELSPEIFIDIVEQMVVSNRSLEGTLFNTQPGVPIKIVMLDDAWKLLAEQLVEHYS